MHKLPLNQTVILLREHSLQMFKKIQPIPQENKQSMMSCCFLAYSERKLKIEILLSQPLKATHENSLYFTTAGQHFMIGLISNSLIQMFREQGCLSWEYVFSSTPLLQLQKVTFPSFIDHKLNLHKSLHLSSHKHGQWDS